MDRRRPVKEASVGGSTKGEKKQKDGYIEERPNGGSTSEIIDRNYLGPNPISL